MFHFEIVLWLAFRACNYAYLHGIVVRIALLFQDRLPWMKQVVERVDADEPKWVDFDAYQRAILRRIRRGQFDPITRRPK